MIVGPRNLAKEIECSIVKFRLPKYVFKGILHGACKAVILQELTPLAEKNVVMVYILYKKYPYHIDISSHLCDLVNVKKKFVYRYKGGFTFKNTVVQINETLKKFL